MKMAYLAVGLTSSVLCFASSALAGPVTVLGTADIYAAGTQSGVADGGYYGTVPGAVSVAAGGYFTFSASGSITLNGGGNYNDADGVGGAVSTSSNTGSGSISGIVAPYDGYLVGVFIGAAGPSGTAPATLDYTSGTPTTSDTSYDPLLDQVFFIGDGLTGDGTGSIQTFYVPTGATELYLGISDAGGYNGSPSSYSDNSGSFSVTTTQVAGPTGISATPEPSSLILLGTGALGVIGAARRKFRRS